MVIHIVASDFDPYIPIFTFYYLFPILSREVNQKILNKLVWAVTLSHPGFIFVVLQNGGYMLSSKKVVIYFCFDVEWHVWSITYRGQTNPPLLFLFKPNLKKRRILGDSFVPMKDCVWLEWGWEVGELKLAKKIGLGHTNSRWKETVRELDGQ